MRTPVEAATATAGAYLGFARAFDYPRAEFWQEAEGVDGLVPVRSQEEREAEYLAAFELGREVPSVSPYEGFCRPGEGREGILEDILRFYEYFDVRLRKENRDYPDHLVSELEFMAFLASREAGALAEGADPESFRRAQRDFLERHLALWAPEFAGRLARTGTIYGQLSRDLADFICAHEATLGARSEGDSP